MKKLKIAYRITVALCVASSVFLLFNIVYLKIHSHLILIPKNEFFTENSPFIRSLKYAFVHYTILLIPLIIGILFLGLIYFSIKLQQKKLGYSLLFILSSSFVGLIAIELGLAYLKYSPGYTETFNYFTLTDNLITYNGFEADSLGITKFPNRAISYNQESFTNSNKLKLPLSKTPNLPDSLYSETYEAWIDYYEVTLDSSINEFSNYYHKLLQQKNLSILEQSVVDYVNRPINDEGFKSITINPKDTSSVKVLLLGDSFTYGHHVDNITSGFSDILLSRGYAVYNTGISGADIKQYELIAKEYIPKIKPEVVIVNLYLGNDLSIYNRTPEPFLPLYYTTSAGNLYTTIQDQNYYTPEDVYHRIISEYQIEQNSLLSQLACATRITSLVWNKLNPIKSSSFYGSNEDELTFVFIKELMNIQELCHKYGAKCIIASIPNCEYYQLEYAKDYPEFFNHFDYVEPTNLSANDYVRNNGHFNEEGHKKYAEFLESFLQEFVDYQGFSNESTSKK